VINFDRLSIFSFFAGSGFLDLGFENSGFNVAYVNEIFSPFMSAYRYSRQALNLPLPEYGYHYGEEADVTKLIEGLPAQRLRELVKDSRKFNNIIGFIGGPPVLIFLLVVKIKDVWEIMANFRLPTLN
jgi:DNA (cytosine-5)-methyltransferase 1